MALSIVIAFIILVSVLLVLIVLLQNKSGGLVQPSGANQLMGVKKTTDLLEKITWGFAGALMLLTIVTSFLDNPVDYQDEQEQVEAPIQDEATAPEDESQEQAPSELAPDSLAQ